MSVKIVSFTKDSLEEDFKIAIADIESRIPDCDRAKYVRCRDEWLNCPDGEVEYESLLEGGEGWDEETVRLTKVIAGIHRIWNFLYCIQVDAQEYRKLWKALKEFLK